MSSDIKIPKISQKHLLGIKYLSVEDINKVLELGNFFKLKNKEKNKNYPILTGRTVINLFFEPSTRTLISFEIAAKRLGADVVNMNIQGSSLRKGETLFDTAQTIGAMNPDLVIIRHNEDNSAEKISNLLDCPIINAGEGINEHPTQALLDLYTIRRELLDKGKNINGLSIAMIGDLRHGRTVHSLTKLLSLYDGVRVTLVSPRELSLPDGIVESMRNAGVDVRIRYELAKSIVDVDIVYSTRIQEERFSNKQEADLYRGKFRLNQAIYTQYCQPNTVIMHPLPRDSRSDANELDNDLDDNPNLAIFRQTDNGLLVRMALFALVLDVADKVEKFSADVNWYNSRQSSKITR